MNFELALEGEPPAGAEFSGAGPLVGLPEPLADGDGTYTGTATVQVTLNPDGHHSGGARRDLRRHRDRPVRGPTEPFPDATDGLVLVDFGPAVLEEGQTLSGSYSFEEGEGTTLGETTGGPSDEQYEDCSVDESDSEFAAQTSEAGAEATPEEGTLPDTGGVLLPLAGASLLLAAGGLLARHASR